MNAHLPRLMSKDGICAYLGGISTATYDQWAAKGIVPGPMRGTNRYDVRAHDIALDRWSGLTEAQRGESALSAWKNGKAA